MLYEYFISYAREDDVKGMCGIKLDKKIKTFEDVAELAKIISDKFHEGKIIIIDNFILLNTTYGG